MVEDQRHPYHFVYFLTPTHACTDMPILREWPEPNLATALDSKLHLRVVATGHPGVTLSYQWLRDAKTLGYATSSDLVISRMGVKDFGAYNCRVTSDLGVSVLTPSCVVSRECGWVGGWVVCWLVLDLTFLMDR